MILLFVCFFFFFKQKTAYEMRISDWSSDVCSSDLRWLGAYDSIDDEDVELDRIVCLGRLDGKWFCATMLVDGDGRAHGMMGCRQFRSLVLARDAMLHAHGSGADSRGEAASVRRRIAHFFVP